MAARIPTGLFRLKVRRERPLGRSANLEAEQDRPPAAGDHLPLYFCYSVGYMPDWGGQYLRISERIYQDLPAHQREILDLK